MAASCHCEGVSPKQSPTYVEGDCFAALAVTIIWPEGGLHRSTRSDNEYTLSPEFNLGSRENLRPCLRQLPVPLFDQLGGIFREAAVAVSGHNHLVA